MIECVEELGAEAQRRIFPPRSVYEAMILKQEHTYAVLLYLREPERTLTLLAAGTGLRISECLGLQWQDVSFDEGMIHVRRPAPMFA